MSSPDPDVGTATWAESWQQVAERLDVNPSLGLSDSEVKIRLVSYGANLLSQRDRQTAWHVLVNQFKSLIIGLLVAAAIVAFIYGETLESLAIVVVIVFNTAIGFFTELHAVRSMEALLALGRVTTRVQRNGALVEIPAEDLIPGDIVIIEGGDVITADLRIIEASELQANESTLTGESLPVLKQEAPVVEEALLSDRQSMLYKGTSITRGSGRGVVVTTGMQTELGDISALVAEADDDDTPLELHLAKLGHTLVWVTLAITFIIIVSGALTGKDIVLMVETGLALAVAAIPEGLPVVATIALARGMRRMAQRNALINRLASVETLGATSVIFTDKTGTLTENRMTLTELALHEHSINIGQAGDAHFSIGEKPVNLEDTSDLYTALKIAVLCNNASVSADQSDSDSHTTGDPLEIALLEAGVKGGLQREHIIIHEPKVREDAFDSESKMMATYHQTDTDFLVAVKGAPESVLASSVSELTAEGVISLTDDSRAWWEEKNVSLADRGLRVITLAMKRVASPNATPYSDLVMVGLAGLLDPPRKDIADAIEQCHMAGIQIVMVTGDQSVTARGIGRKVGLVNDGNDHVVNGADIGAIDQMNSQEHQSLLRTLLFARVSPRQKLSLVELHQANDHVVAMTGDGVNDAPALKKADIGVAMGLRGTAVAKNAADMVLQDDAFSTIVAAVREGRAIFNNIRTFVVYLMSCNVSEVLVVALATLFGGTLPLLPLQILFLNLVTDVFPALALGVGQGASNLMEQSPRNSKEPILTRQHWTHIAMYGAVFTVAVLGALIIAEHIMGIGTQGAVTVSFLTLAFAQLWHVFNMRAASSNIFINEITQNPLVWYALILCVVLILSAVYIPVVAEALHIMQPDLRSWCLILPMSLLPLGFGQALLYFNRVNMSESINEYKLES